LPGRLVGRYVAQNLNGTSRPIAWQRAAPPFRGKAESGTMKEKCAWRLFTRPESAVTSSQAIIYWRQEIRNESYLDFIIAACPFPEAYNPEKGEMRAAPTGH
jgi:hypothetical protein